MDLDHLKLLQQGVHAWNKWREREPPISVDLSGANLMGANLMGANLFEANLNGTNLNGANLMGANLGRADLSEAILFEAELWRANLSRANLSEADLSEADLTGAHLGWANLTEANLTGAHLGKAHLIAANLFKAKLIRANLTLANLSEANLTGAHLGWADLTEANLFEADLGKADLIAANLFKAKLIRANLNGANLCEAGLVDADLTGADLTGCHIYGISAWGLKLDEHTNQQGLIITPLNEPEITVDNIEVAQFVYLLLHNKNIRNIINTITTKAVLILGRFTKKRKEVLNALRQKLRQHDYLPILFDFDVPDTRDITETVSLLARMARFIIADLTDPSSIPKELEAIVPGLAVPVQPLLEGSARPYAMFKDYWKYDWVLPVYWYEGIDPLLETLAEKVIAPAEAKVKVLEDKRRAFEAELTAPRTSP